MTIKISNGVKKKIAILFSIFALLVIFGMAGFVNAVGYEIPFPSAVEEAAAGEGIAGYVNRLYIYALGLVGLTALGAIIFGGILYTTSAGNPSLQGDAKKRITSALIGLGILLTSYLILYTINPDLVNLRNPSIAANYTIKAPELGVTRACEGATDCGTGYRCEGYIQNVSKGACILIHQTQCQTGTECGDGYNCTNGRCERMSTLIAQNCGVFTKGYACNVYKNCSWQGPNLDSGVCLNK